MKNKVRTNMKRGSAVLLVANYSNITGYAWNNIFRLFNSIARSCQDNGFSICISFAEIEKQVDIFDTDIKTKSFVFNPYKISFHSLVALRQAIKENNIKYIYFTDMKPWHWLYPLLRIWGIKKIIVHCRVSVANPHPATPEKGLKKLIKSLINKVPFIRVDYIYAISEFVRERLVNKDCYPKGRVIKILNGIDVNRYLCKEDSAGQDDINIFCCARASKHKGIPTLIEAAQILKQKYKLENYCIQYAGSGPDLDSFKGLAKELDVADKIVFLGQLDSTHEVACDSDIIVVPSEWGEGFGSTVAEGMAAGKAVVATRAGGIPEIIGGPEYGMLVEPGNSNELADAIYELTKNGDVREKLGQKARIRVRKYFNESLYHQLVTERILQDFED